MLDAVFLLISTDLSMSRAIRSRHVMFGHVPGSQDILEVAFPSSFDRKVLDVTFLLVKKF